MIQKTNVWIAVGVSFFKLVMGVILVGLGVSHIIRRCDTLSAISLVYYLSTGQKGWIQLQQKSCDRTDSLNEYDAVWNLSHSAFSLYNTIRNIGLEPLFVLS